MPRSDIPCAAALLEKFFDHPQRNTKPQSDLLTVAILAVIRSQDSFPQIQRESSHGSNVIKASPIWLQFYLKCSSRRTCEESGNSLERRWQRRKLKFWSNRSFIKELLTPVALGQPKMPGMPGCLLQSAQENQR